MNLANVCTEVDTKTVLNVQWDYHCCSCDYNYSQRQQDCILYLPVPDDAVSVYLQQLFTIAEGK